MNSIRVVGRTVPETWEKALMQTWEQGSSVQTEYDRPNDPLIQARIVELENYD